MAEGGAEEELDLDGSPTWIVAIVCTVIISISLLFDQLLHRVGKILLRKNQKPLFQALQQMKEELMVMGFISLLLVGSQGAIQKICIPKSYTRHLRPCKGQDLAGKGKEDGAVVHGVRRQLSGGASDHCTKQGKVPLLSIEAIHELHVFIFALAATHVFLSVKTIFLAGVKIHKWKFWEDSIHEETQENASRAPMITPVHEILFRHNRYRSMGKDSVILTWVHAFFKQFFSSITMSEYRTMRLGFIMTHCSGNLKFNFHNYMVRALESDYKKVASMSWYLWISMIVFLLMNVGGWHEYFWLSFVPLILLLTIGTKLEYIITKMTNEVAEKRSTLEGELAITPSDQYFWLHRPRILLFCIHLILFIVAFEVAYFLWILIAYGYSSCVMDKTEYAIPRLIISIGVRIFASYRTLPLYAIVTQMGSTFKSVIFAEHIKEGLIQWAQKAKKTEKSLSSTVSEHTAEEVQLQILFTPEAEDSFIQEAGADIVKEVKSLNSPVNEQKAVEVQLKGGLEIVEVNGSNGKT